MHEYRYKDAFERIQRIVGGDGNTNLDKIVADFVKVEDQNFALFNYVTEMNNQVMLNIIQRILYYCTGKG